MARKKTKQPTYPIGSQSDWQPPHELSDAAKAKIGLPQLDVPRPLHPAMLPLPDGVRFASLEEERDAFHQMWQLERAQVAELLKDLADIATELHFAQQSALGWEAACEERQKLTDDCLNAAVTGHDHAQQLLAALKSAQLIIEKSRGGRPKIMQDRDAQIMKLRKELLPNGKKKTPYQIRMLIVKEHPNLAKQANGTILKTDTVKQVIKRNEQT